MESLSIKEQIKSLIEEHLPGEYDLKIYMNHLVVTLPDENFQQLVSRAKKAIHELIEEKCPGRKEKILIDFRSELYEDSLMIEK